MGYSSEGSCANATDHPEGLSNCSPSYRAEGGSGPGVFLVEQDPPSPRTPRLRSIFGLRSEEDLWVELTFYPNKDRMKKIIGKIWKQKQFTTHPDELESLLSKRKAGYQGTLAYAALQQL